MKKIILIMIIFILPPMMWTLGCNKSETPKSGAQKNDEILLNPVLFEELEDYNIHKAITNFYDKSFKLLGSNCWGDSKTKKVMILFSSATDEGHSTGADIGGLFIDYSYETNIWELKANSLSFTQEGSWGVAPEPHFIKLGPDKYGFIIQTDYCHQGFKLSTLGLYSVIGNSFVQMLSIPSYSENSGTTLNKSDVYEVKVNLYQIIDSKKDFYDMKAQLTIRGKYFMVDDYYGYSKVFGESSEANFQFRDGLYVVSRNH